MSSLERLVNRALLIQIACLLITTILCTIIYRVWFVCIHPTSALRLMLIRMPILVQKIFGILSWKVLIWIMIHSLNFGLFLFYFKTLFLSPSMCLLS
jgi:hypothetical protein